MDKRTRGCLWAGLGIAVLASMVVAGLGGGAAWLVYQGSAIEHVRPTRAQADVRFEEVRRRFARQAPLVTIGAGGRPRVTARERAGESSTLETFHVMAWKEAQGELTHVQLPFWLLRLTGGHGRLSVDGAVAELDRLNLSVEDIERAGPGLVLDHLEPDGGRVLIWTE